MIFMLAVSIVIFIAIVWFVWTHIASDLPDDFLKFLKQKNRKEN